MRWITVAASAAAGALVLLGTLWIGGGAAPVTRAADTGTIVGWVYWGLPPYGRPYGVEGQAPAGQPAYPVPSSRGLYALRTNVAVGSTAKPINVGALFVGRTWYGPMPTAQPDQPPQGAPSEGGG